MAQKTKRALTEVEEADYYEACESYTGWCKTCREFTREMTEPDADGYDCPVCKELSVVGAENALIMGLITFA